MLWRRFFKHVFNHISSMRMEMLAIYNSNWIMDCLQTTSTICIIRRCAKWREKLGLFLRTPFLENQKIIQLWVLSVIINLYYNYDEFHTDDENETDSDCTLGWQLNYWEGGRASNILFVKCLALCKRSIGVIINYLIRCK